VPAVELASRVGTPAFLNVLHLAGFSSLDQDAEFYGLGLALGNGDVTLIELANAYRSLAAGGVWHPWTWRSAAGSQAGRRVASAAASAIVLNVLSDASARVPGFGLITPFDFPFPVAVKTGTSRHFTDNWAVGVTGRFTVAVWAGNFNGRPMQGVSGVTGAGPLLHRVVMATAQHYEPGSFATPDQLGARRATVCRLSGLLATQRCARLDEWFMAGTAPTQTDDWEHDGGVTLPDEFADWAQQNMRALVRSASGERPPAPVSRKRVADASFRVLSPLDGDRYAIPIGVDARFATIPLRAAGPGSEDVSWTVDGHPQSSERWSLVPGPHIIEAVSARRDTIRVRIAVDR